MNLPSIFKSAPNMKNITPDPQSSQQDMFGLGIQVFKIQSKKQITTTHKTNKSVGKFRNEIKQTQTPMKRTTVIPAVPPKRQKKTSAILPRLKQQRQPHSADVHTDTIISKKSTSRPSGSIKKLDSIKQGKPKPIRHISKDVKSINKTLDKIQAPKNIPKTEPESEIIKKCYIEEHNRLLNFYEEQLQYHRNEETKVGKKKNQDLHDETNTNNFIDAYNQKEPCFYQSQPQYYQEFSITSYLQG